MRKSIFFVAGFVFLVLILTGCSQSVDPEPEKYQTNQQVTLLKP